MKLLLIFSFLLMNTTFANLTIDDSKQIVLRGDNCEQLNFQAESILAWSHKIGENTYEELPECYSSESGKSIIDVYAISPSMVRKYQGVKPEYSGPNCWNRALVFAKILPSLTYSTPEEMTFWMESPICQERTLEEEAQPGDIIVVRKAYGSPEIHGFTYITNDLTFSKNGYSNRSPYEYQSLNKVLSVYGVPANCGRIFGKPDSDHECYRKAYGNYFNCMTVEEYFEKSNIVISEENVAIYQRLIEIDADVFSYIFNENKALDKEYLKGLAAELNWGIDYAKTYLLSDELDQNSIFFWNALMRRAEALVAQISLIR